MWALVTAFGTGLVLGLRFRVPAVLCVTSLMILACIVEAALSGAPMLGALMTAVTLAFSLQVGYLVGLMLLMCTRS